MLQFTEPFLAFASYCAPGFCAAIPYWVLFRVGRTRGDYLAILVAFILYFRGLQEVLSILLIFVFGSSFMFGAWGASIADGVTSGIGLASGLYMGIRYRARSKGDEDFFPFDRYDFR